MWQREEIRTVTTLEQLRVGFFFLNIKPVHQPALNDMALEIRKYGSKKCGGKNQNCPEKPGHMTLGYITYSPEFATPA